MTAKHRIVWLDAQAPWLWGARYRQYYASISRSRRRYAPDRRRTSDDPAKVIAAEARLRHRFEASLVSSTREPKFWNYVELMRRKDADAALVFRAHMGPEFQRWRRDNAADGSVADCVAAVRARCVQGFIWRGGCVGGNAAYQVPAFRFAGLVSDLHPILQFFVSKLPRGRRLVCGNHKAELSPAAFGSKLLGCDAPYIEGLKSMRGFLRVEIDRPMTVDAIELACQQAGVPKPNLVVGWQDGDTIVHPHLIWLLLDSVAFTDRSKRPFQSLFRGVLRGLTAALLPYGADPGGLCNCMRIKNPLSPLWNQHVLAEVPYSLNALAARVDTRATLPGGPAEGVAPAGPVMDHPDPAIAMQSNAAFRHLAAWARREIRCLGLAGEVDESEWHDRVVQHALHITAQLTEGGHGGDRERTGVQRSVQRLARSVSRWTWKNVRRDGVSNTPLRRPPEASSSRAAAAQRTARLRTACTQARILAAIQALAAAGMAPTQVAVHAAICDTGGKISLRTVERHWASVRAEFAAAAPTNGPPVKKESFHEQHTRDQAVDDAPLNEAYHQSGLSMSGARTLPSDHEQSDGPLNRGLMSRPVPGATQQPGAGPPTTSDPKEAISGWRPWQQGRCQANRKSAPDLTMEQPPEKVTAVAASDHQRHR